MSTYTHRYVEVLIDQIDGIRWKYKDLPDPETVVGKIYKISEYNRPEGVYKYYTSVKHGDSPAQWEGKDTNEKKWTLMRWFSDRPETDKNEDYEAQLNRFNCSDKFGRHLHMLESIMWCNNGGHIRDDFIGNGWGDCVFKGRGIPSDVSEEVKKDIESDYHYGMTYVTLAEWDKMFESELSKFVAEVKKRFRDEKLDKVMTKLDDILKYSIRSSNILSKMQDGSAETVKEPHSRRRKKNTEEGDDFMWEDSIDYMFEEEIWKLFNIQTEIDRCEFIVEDVCGLYTDRENVRIIYYLA